jgi:hypothetical protein
MLAFRRLDIVVAQPGSPPDGTAIVMVCWDLVTQHTGVGKVSFRVERSLSPQFIEGEFTVLESEIPGVDRLLVYEYDDITPNLFNWWRKYYYRIVATTPEGEVSSAIRTWETNPRPHELAIIERHDFVLRYLQGEPSFAFVERTTEALFCECYNVTTQRPTKSGCTICLGTGRQRPYFEPIPFFVDYNPDEKLVSISNLGETQEKGKDCWFSAFPQVKPGDLIYEVGPAVLWRVARLNAIQPQGTTIQHVCRLAAIDRFQVEYKALIQRIPQETLIALVQEWERIKEERLF